MFSKGLGKPLGKADPGPHMVEESGKDNPHVIDDRRTVEKP